MVDEKLRIEYIRLDKAIELVWPENPKMHHLQALTESFQKHGFRDAPAFDEKLAEGGAIVDGNGRVEALWWMYNESQTNDEVKPPRGIALDDGMWCLPVQFGISAASKAAAESYALDANNLTLLGGEFTAFDIARMYDQEAYLKVLAETAAADVMPASVDGDDLDALWSSVEVIDAGDGSSPGIRTRPGNVVVINISKFTGLVRRDDLADIPIRLIRRFGNGDSAATDFLMWLDKNIEDES